jgi:hypothetical protein
MGRCSEEQWCGTDLACLNRPSADVNGVYEGVCCRAAAKNFKGKKLEKGVAFPTCISVNK